MTGSDKSWQEGHKIICLAISKFSHLKLANKEFIKFAKLINQRYSGQFDTRLRIFSTDESKESFVKVLLIARICGRQFEDMDSEPASSISIRKTRWMPSSERKSLRVSRRIW